jgi:hypothetical protein
MSKATSIRGEKYEENFRTGFVFKNATHMEHHKFKSVGKDVYGINTRGGKGELIGDIDGYYVSTSEKYLRELLPVPNGLNDYSFVVKKGAHVFFELTTQSGDALGMLPAKYIKKKVDFHKKLISNDAFKWRINKTDHVLIFCFNGADNVKVSQVFNDACKQHGICGVSVYLASDVVDQWFLELKNGEQSKEIVKQSKEIAELKRQLSRFQSSVLKLGATEVSVKRGSTATESARKKSKVK